MIMAPSRIIDVSNISCVRDRQARFNVHVARTALSNIVVRSSSMDVENDDDTVVAEYPLYTASIGSIYGQAGDIRLVHLQYPLRPAWRGYSFEGAKSVEYKPEHRMMSVTLPEDQPAGVRASPACSCCSWCRPMSTACAWALPVKNSSTSVSA